MQIENHFEMNTTLLITPNNQSEINIVTEDKATATKTVAQSAAAKEHSNVKMLIQHSAVVNLGANNSNSSLNTIDQDAYQTKYSIAKKL